MTEEDATDMEEESYERQARAQESEWYDEYDDEYEYRREQCQWPTCTRSSNCRMAGSAARRATRLLSGRHSRNARTGLSTSSIGAGTAMDELQPTYELTASDGTRGDLWRSAAIAWFARRCPRWWSPERTARACALFADRVVAEWNEREFLKNCDEEAEIWER